MEYVHIRSLEKYHPGYKDRELRWAKIHFRMVQGDPDCELIEDEVDWARLIKMIILELQAMAPLPNSDAYWRKKGFDIENRPMSLTLQMLHNFIEIVTESEKICGLEKRREEKIVLQEKPVTQIDKAQKEGFETIWELYPEGRKFGKKSAVRSFNSTVKSKQDFENILKAVHNFKEAMERERRPKEKIPYAQTWFNNWQDWVNVS